MEKLMQYVWQHRLWLQRDMVTVDGRRVEVIDQGRLNVDSGPDFFNAKVRIDGEMWAGNVEIHVRASDWRRHGHDSDRAYDTVVLHVVGMDDAEVRRRDGSVIPQLLMPCASDFSERYARMVGNPLSELACAADVGSLPGVFLDDWLSALSFERLYGKVDRIMGLLERFRGSWAEVVYVTLARALGFGVNSEPFERLALGLPVRVMMKHRDSLLSVESMLFGQAGFLEGDAAGSDDGYVRRLADEYRFLSNKFGLRPCADMGWKLSRMRPQNFPHRRIAALAAYVHGGFDVGHAVFEASDEEELRRAFSVELTGYWASRYSFASPSACTPSALGRGSVSLLIINVAVPLIYARGLWEGDTVMQDRAVDILMGLRPERNSIVGLFESAGIRCRDAFTSQALIQLRRGYCELRKCLFCRIGHRLLAMKARP